MKIDVKQALKDFIDDRKDRFPKVTENQKSKWVKAIETHLDDMLCDNDVFYDFMPDDVVEAD